MTHTRTGGSFFVPLLVPFLLLPWLFEGGQTLFRRWEGRDLDDFGSFLGGKMIPLFFFFRLLLIFTGCKFPITTTTGLLLHNYLLHTQIRTYVTYVQMPREHTTSRGVLTPSRRLAGSGTRIHHAIHTGTDPVISSPPPILP